MACDPEGCDDVAKLWTLCVVEERDFLPILFVFLFSPGNVNRNNRQKKTGAWSNNWYLSFTGELKGTENETFGHGSGNTRMCWFGLLCSI